MSNNFPAFPYTNWTTAATNIQDAVSVAEASDTVAVSRGNYSFGGGVIFGGETNRVLLTNAITLLSVDGWQGVISGDIQTRCAYVGSNAVLIGFTITNGHTLNSGDIANEQSGGGIWCQSGGVVSNCLIIGNFAGQNNGMGGGVFGGTIYSSTIKTNGARYGGGAAMAALYDCAVVSNSWLYSSYPTISIGGGLYQGLASNCIFTANQAYDAGGGASGSTLYNCNLNGNQTYYHVGGAGAYRSTLYNCMVISNTSYLGYGSITTCTAYNCSVTGNSGGGSRGGVLCNCILLGNADSAGGGGGANGGTLYDCILTGNTSASGGGASSGTLYNCLITGNTAKITGGGAINAGLFNCTVAGNTATNNVGGIYGGTAHNTIIYGNVSLNNSNWAGSQLYYCCTAPGAIGVVTTNSPLFTNQASDGYYLQPNSPCINAGFNGFVFATNDLAGNPRIKGSTVDIGAYEFQTPASILSYAWAQRFGVTTDGSTDYSDPDGDGFSNWEESKAGTNPNDPASFLKMISTSNSVFGTTVAWQSVGGIMYFLQSSTNLAGSTSFSMVETNIFGQVGITSFTDPTATNDGPYFYRVGVQ